VYRLTVSSKNRRPANRPGEVAQAGRNPRLTIVIYLALAAISVAVFGQTSRYEFVNFDDDLYVYNAPAVQTGLTLKGIAFGFSGEHARNWHPVTTISHMLDCQLYGLTPGRHHVTNVLLHTLAVLLLFWVLREMTGAVWKSAIVTALFAVHPLHVESVAWVSERKDVLSAVFFFVMLDAYVRYARAPSITRYLAVAVLFALGLMSKPMLVTTPFILLLLDYWPLGRLEQTSSVKGKAKTFISSGQRRVILRLFLEKVPLVVLAAVASAITFVLQKRATGAIPPLPLLWRVENSVVSYLI
jgi:hypothetical protein